MKKILAFVVNNDINQNPDPNIYRNTFLV